VGLSANAQQIKWYKSYKEASAVAKELGKPMLLDFTAGWCKPCQVLEKVFWVRKDIVDLSDRFVCVKVNFDENKSLAGKYRIRSIPHVLIMDSWGFLLFAESGLNIGRLPSDIEVVPRDFTQLIETGRLLEKDDLNALKIFGDFYQQEKLYAQSNTFYQRVLKAEKNSLEREGLMVRIGLNKLRAEDNDDALDIFEKFAKEFPQSAQMESVLFGQTVAYYKKNKLKNAQSSLEQLKLKFPKSVLIADAERMLAQTTPPK
jgi:thioredoxin-like negative regulator of GroEL